MLAVCGGLSVSEPAAGSTNSREAR